MSDQTQSVAEPQSAETADLEREPMTLHLVLSDFTLIETFQGFYDYGERDMEIEPAHRITIKAKWKNVSHQSGRPDRWLLLGEREINPEIAPLLMRAAVSKDEAEKSHASHHGLFVNIAEDVFSALVATVRRGEIEEAMMLLQAEPPWEGALGIRHRLVFGNLEVTSRVRVDRWRQTVVGLLKQSAWPLYVIIGLLVAILLRL
jgi:hypothetical protein